MPKVKAGSEIKMNKRAKKETSQDNNSYSAASDDSFGIPNSPAASDTLKNGTKEETVDFSGEMSKLLERFTSEVNKTMQAKRKKLEQFTQDSTRSTTRKVLETNKAQSAERRKLIDHFRSQFFAMIQQGESELEKIKEMEDKLQKLIVQQQKHQQQLRISHSQKMKALKNLSEEFCKNELKEKEARAGENGRREEKNKKGEESIRNKRKVQYKKNKSIKG